MTGLLDMCLADFSHAIKTTMTAVESRILRGPVMFPIIMKTLKNIYIETPDMKTDGQIMMYPKFRIEISEKNAKIVCVFPGLQKATRKTWPTVLKDMDPTYLTGFQFITGILQLHMPWLMLPLGSCA